MRLRDIDIRNALYKVLLKLHRGEPNTVIVSELGLCQGLARIDVAVVDGSILGYEIKSEKDTLQRLPSQVEVYNRIFDEITLITCANHADNVRSMIPPWWGITLVEKRGSPHLVFKDIRDPANNPLVDLFSVAQLLWRDEAIGVLKKYNLERGMLSKPRKEIWKRLSDKLPRHELVSHVRSQLKVRRNWRSDLIQKSSGGNCQLFAT